MGDTSASGGSSYHSEETECLLDVDRTHYLRLSNRIKEKLKRRCSFQVFSDIQQYNSNEIKFDCQMFLFSFRRLLPRIPTTSAVRNLAVKFTIRQYSRSAWNSAREWTTEVARACQLRRW